MVVAPAVAVVEWELPQECERSHGEVSELTAFGMGAVLPLPKPPQCCCAMLHVVIIRAFGPAPQEGLLSCLSGL